MDLQQLRYLRAVVRTGSVTAAAEQEFVAQPAVSKQLKLLEAELGLPLFHRVGRRVVATEAASRLADCTDRMLDDLAATIAAISEGSTAPQRLAICATETVVDHLLPPALAALLVEFPNLQLSIEMLGTDDALTRVLNDAADLAIVVLPLSDPRLDVQPLLTEPVVLALPPGHRLAEGDGPVPLAEALGDDSLLLSMRGHGLRTTVESAALQAGITLTGRLELRSQQALLALVAAGAGITFAPALSATRRQDIAVRLTDPPLERQLGWVRRRGRHLPAAAAWLLKRLESGSAASAS